MGKHLQNNLASGKAHIVLVVPVAMPLELDIWYASLIAKTILLQ